MKEIIVVCQFSCEVCTKDCPRQPKCYPQINGINVEDFNFGHYDNCTWLVGENFKP